MGSIWRRNQRPPTSSSTPPRPRSLINGSKYLCSHLRCSRRHTSAATENSSLSRRHLILTSLWLQLLSLHGFISPQRLYCNWLFYLKPSLTQNIKTQQHCVQESVSVKSAFSFLPNQTIYIHIVQKTVISMKHREPFTPPVSESASTVHISFSLSIIVLLQTKQ